MARINFAGWYRRFRTSKSFLAGLATFIASWIGLHIAVGFDPDFGTLNLILSAEASIGMALFMMISDRQEAAQRQMLQHQAHLLEAMHALLQKQIGDAETSCGSCSGESPSSPA